MLRGGGGGARGMGVENNFFACVHTYVCMYVRMYVFTSIYMHVYNS